jgi:UDPglucose 6-dehydrogenase
MLPPRLSIILAPTALDAVDGADALAVLTDWREFSEVPLGEVVGRMRGDLVLDGRNMIDPDGARHVGLRYLGVGRGRARQLVEMPA